MNTPDMVTKRYAHILDEDRKNLANEMESSFYKVKTKESATGLSSEMQSALELIQNNPDLLKVLQSIQFANK